MRRGNGHHRVGAKKEEEDANWLGRGNARGGGKDLLGQRDEVCWDCGDSRRGWTEGQFRREGGERGSGQGQRVGR